MAVARSCGLAADLLAESDLAGAAQLCISGFFATHPCPRCRPRQGAWLPSRPAEADAVRVPAVDRWLVLLFVFAEGQALQNPGLDVHRPIVAIRHCQGPRLLHGGGLPYALRRGECEGGSLAGIVAAPVGGHFADVALDCAGGGYCNCSGAHAAAGAG